MLEQLSNATTIEQPNGKATSVPLPMVDIIRNVTDATNGWPCRVGSALFAYSQERVDWISSAAALFGWLGSQTGVVDWKRGEGYTTKDELFAELRRVAKAYDAVELLPHVPPLATHFYAHPSVRHCDGSRLNRLLDFFCPATNVDRELIKAAFVTPFWGGRGGSRPGFIVTADAGRGAGKSKLVEMVGRIAGGLLDFSTNEDGGQIKQRLLSPDGLSARVALLDNVKTLRFSWAELEALMTAPNISGKRLYVGEASRPNTLTWFITINGASLSTDIAQRCVIVKLAPPQRSGTWETEVSEYIDVNAQGVVGDIVSLLSARAAPLARFSRWALWEQAVLARLNDPAALQASIAERQQLADVELDESQIVEDYFRQRLEALNYDADVDRVHIPTGVAAEWFKQATGERHSVTGASRLLTQKHDEGKLTQLAPNPCRSYGRGFVWTGDQADLSETVRYDITDRQRLHSTFN